MPDKLRWFDRRFNFDFPAELGPAIVERLRGAPLRVAERIHAIPETLWTSRDEGWSIQQNVGHMLDLEPLWAGRVVDLLSGEDVLRPADLTNQKTEDAGHDSRAMAELVTEFRDTRRALVARLERLALEDYARCARHPRLDQPMRLVDLAFFVAEHDDWHLAAITEIARGRGDGSE